MLVVLTNIPTPYRTAFFNVLNKRLAKQNISFHVFYMGKTEPRRFWDFQPEENYYEYTFLKGFHPTFKNYYPHINPTVVRQIRKLNPQWILLAGSWNAPSVIHVLLKRGTLKAKTIFWSEGHMDAQRSQSAIINRLRGMIYSAMDGFVVPNNKSRDYIKLFNGSAPIGMLPNTVDEEFFNVNLLASKSQLRKINGFAEDDKIVVSVATLNDRKGSWELLKAYAMLTQDQQKQLKLIYIGEGENMDKLEVFKNKHNLYNVYLLGQKNPEEVRSYLHMADFFILPTKLDPNPLTPIEASFMRTPLILSRFAGNHAELLNNDTGFYLDEIMPEAIHKVLVQVLEMSGEQIEAMGAAAYYNVQNNFSRLSAAENLISFIKTL